MSGRFRCANGSTHYTGGDKGQRLTIVPSREIVKEPIGHIGFEFTAWFGIGESVMSRKMMIAVMAGTIGLLANHLASARGGGAHGGLHALPGAAVRATAPYGAVARSNTGAAGTSSGNGGHMVVPNLGSILLGNGVGPVSGPTIPSNVGASPAGVRGASPGSANGGGLNNLGINPNGAGMSGTGASPPLTGSLPTTTGASPPLAGSLPTTVSSPTIPSNVGTAPAGVRGASPGSANGGGLNNLGINPNGTGMSGTGASPPPAGTNTAGAALSSGLPTNRGSDHPATRQSADKAKPPRTDQDAVNDSEAAKIDRVVKSICTGC